MEARNRSLPDWFTHVRTGQIRLLTSRPANDGRDSAVLLRNRRICLAVLATSLTALAALFSVTGSADARRVFADIARAVEAPPLAREAVSPVVLGSRRFYAPGSRGFGTARPRTIYNGGVPSGLVSRITWTGWGSSQAFGRGLTSIYKPGGGYYRQRVTIRLRAYSVGTCPAEPQLAYRRLAYRVPSRPGAPLQGWRYWSGRSEICTNPLDD
jgi:hypothetical protein